MIKKYIEQTIRNLEAERDNELRTLEQRITQEKIVPFNREADIRKDKAIEQKTNAFNAQVSALQETFAKEKQDIIVANENYKKENAERILAAESAFIMAKYSATIERLTKMLNDEEE